MSADAVIYHNYFKSPNVALQPILHIHLRVKRASSSLDALHPSPKPVARGVCGGVWAAGLSHPCPPPWEMEPLVSCGNLTAVSRSPQDESEVLVVPPLLQRAPSAWCCLQV